MTYDQWKTTDPREYEPEPEEEPSEVELLCDRLQEVQADSEHAAKVAAIRIKELETALCECLEYFKDRYDVKDGDNGQQLPNEEVRLGTMVDETLYGIRF